MEWILGVLARRNGSTKEQVRKEMEMAMLAGMGNKDPLVQRQWAQIPKQGEKLTLEEFLDYLISQYRSKTTA